MVRKRYSIGLLAVSSAFDDVAATAPIAKDIAVVRDFVFAANLLNGDEPDKVQWSDINDETDWTSGATSQSDFQIIPDGGNIQAMSQVANLVWCF